LRRDLSAIDLKMTNLTIMVAPNGARKSHADHPNLPVTIDEVAREAVRCQTAGVQAIHVHVRDDAGRHSIDGARYLQATHAVRSFAGPDLIVQITTEAVGQFTPPQQIATVRAVAPEAVSIAVKELVPDASAEAAAAELYGWAHQNRIAVQHIVYAADEFDRLLDLSARGIIPGKRHSLIFPLGRYVADQESDPAELIPFVAKLLDNGGTDRFDWWVCAFGAAETASLVAAAAMGGHCRIGFENSFINADGSRADSNAARIADLQRSLVGIRRAPASRGEALRMLGRPD
jgi:3-keto-5-aminohexanoate cleavage enzyme